MNDTKEKFATFFANASKGKKIGAILLWVSAAVLLVGLFVPFLNVGIFSEEDVAFKMGATPTWNDAIEYASMYGTEKEQSKCNALSEAVSAMSSQWESAQSEFTMEELEAKKLEWIEFYNPISHKISLLSYLIHWEPVLNRGSAFGIGMLVLYSALIIATIVLAIFTMDSISCICAVLAALEVALVYFLRVGAVVDPNGSEVLPISFSFVCMILLAVVAVLAPVGFVVSLVVKEPDEEYDGDWDNDEDDDRNAETGLFDRIMLVQLNTGTSFEVPSHKETVLGKSHEADIVIQNPVISRMHAKIVSKNGNFRIVDLASRNGTYVGDHKLPSGGSATLTNGTYITLGNEIFQVVTDANTVSNLRS